MGNLLAVGLGGCVGALLRFGVAIWIPRMPWSETVPIPVGTLCVNLTGCLLIGILKGLADAQQIFSPTITLLLFTGLLGSFTTFSTFGLETVQLMQTGQWLSVVLYVGISVVIGILLVWVGYRLSVSVA